MLFSQTDVQCLMRVTFYCVLYVLSEMFIIGVRQSSVVTYS